MESIKLETSRKGFRKFITLLGIYTINILNILFGNRDEEIRILTPFSQSHTEEYNENLRNPTPVMA